MAPLKKVENFQWKKSNTAWQQNATQKTEKSLIFSTRGEHIIIRIISGTAFGSCCDITPRRTHSSAGSLAAAHKSGKCSPRSSHLVANATPTRARDCNAWMPEQRRRIDQSGKIPLQVFVNLGGGFCNIIIIILANTESSIVHHSTLSKGNCWEKLVFFFHLVEHWNLLGDTLKSTLAMNLLF